jgi:hypothetical protein
LTALLLRLAVRDACTRLAKAASTYPDDATLITVI